MFGKSQILLFSVIIPTFNRAHLLSKTLDSVFAQTFKDYEVIVVDDGSTDGTREYLASVGYLINCFSQPNKGPGQARNLGALHARGEYIAFLDSDDLWFPWTLASFAELIRRHQQPAILGAKVVEFSADSELAAIRETELIADAFADYFVSHRSGYCVGAGMSVMRRDKFLKTGGYTELISNCEDHDLILRMGEAGGFVQIVQPFTLGYRRHSGSITRDSRQSFSGACYLVRQERSGVYPGGLARAHERRAIITRTTRSVTIGFTQSGLLHEAWRLYRATFAWNLALGRWKYLGGFPVKAFL